MTKQYHPPIPLLRQFTFIKTALVMLLFMTSMLSQAQNTWTSQTSASNNTWQSITYSNKF